MGNIYSVAESFFLVFLLVWKTLVFSWPQTFRTEVDEVRNLRCGHMVLFSSSLPPPAIQEGARVELRVSLSPAC